MASQLLSNWRGVSPLLSALGPHVDFYVRDLVHLLCELKLVQSDGEADRERVLSAEPSAAAGEFAILYFKSVLKGQHIVDRPFKYIAATEHNRRSFAARIHRAFTTSQPSQASATGAEQGLLLTPADASALLLLLCPDFPASVLEDAAQCVLPSTRWELQLPAEEDPTLRVTAPSPPPPATRSVSVPAYDGAMLMAAVCAVLVYGEFVALAARAFRRTLADTHRLQAPEPEAAVEVVGLLQALDAGLKSPAMQNKPCPPAPVIDAAIRAAAPGSSSAADTNSGERPASSTPLTWGALAPALCSACLADVLAEAERCAAEADSAA